MKKYAIVFSVFLLFFLILQFLTPYIIDVDTYYHIAVADHIRTSFSLQSTWLTQSILEKADIHWFFHLLLVPFTFFGLVLGAKLAAVIFASLSFTIIYWYLEKRNIPYPYLWMLFIMCGSYILLFRLVSARVYVLSLAILIIGAFLLQEKKWKLLAVLAFFYAWLYSAFAFLFVFAIFFSIAEYIITKKIYIKSLVAIMTGSFLGLIINPFFPDILKVFYVQVFQAFLFPTLTDLPKEALPFPSFGVFP